MTHLNLKTAVLAATAFALTASSAAFAADLGPYKPYDAPPPVVEAPAYIPIWQGAYIGVNGGYGWGTSGVADPEGAFGGGQIGYNWQRDRFVFGLEADLQASDISESADYVTATGFASARSDIDWFSTVRARAGVASGPMLFYATGGVAFADVSNGLDVVDGGTAISFRESDTKTGYAVGGGVEWAFAPNWTMKAEYLYMDFGSDTLAAIGSDGNSYSTDIDTDVHTARVGLNYKF